jgi:catechol 2,3-dioxygenase-like lactoylglutathione lyase family enzyme
MRPTRASGIVAYVKNTADTAAFYNALGFTFTKREPDHLSLDVGGFWLDFHPQDKEDKPSFQREAALEPKGAGQFWYFQVDNVDDFYSRVIGSGLSPSSEPKDWPWGNREFIIRDPDGYKLVFFTPLRG